MNKSFLLDKGHEEYEKAAILNNNKSVSLLFKNLT